MALVSDTQTDLQEQLDEVRDNWSTFLESFQQLVRSMSRVKDSTVEFTVRRIEAYMPNADPGRDWGMGDDADHWFDEIAEAIEQLGPVRCDHCGGLIDENDEVAEIVKVDDGRLGAVYSNMLVHESCYDRETMVLA